MSTSASLSDLGGDQKDSTACILLSLRSLNSSSSEGTTPASKNIRGYEIEFGESLPGQTPLAVEALLSMKSLSPRKRINNVDLRLPSMKHVQYSTDTITQISRAPLTKPICVFKNPSCSPLISWHSEYHVQTRNEIMKYIFLILQKSRKNHSITWYSNIPNIAERLETILYYTASTFEEYCSLSTLRQRVRALATQALSGTYKSM